MDETPAQRLQRLLREHRAEILAVAHRHGAFDVRVFGSVARGDADEASDVDLLVTFETDRSLLDQVGLQQDLADLLGVKVDVVSRGGLSPYIRDAVLREAIPV